MTLRWLISYLDEVWSLLLIDKAGTLPVHIIEYSCTFSISSMPLQRGVSESVLRGPAFRRVTQTRTRSFTGSPFLRLAWPPLFQASSLAWSQVANSCSIRQSNCQLFPPNFSTSMPLVPDPSSFGPNLHRRLQRTSQFSPQRNWLKPFRRAIRRLKQCNSQSRNNKERSRIRTSCDVLIWIPIVFFSLVFLGLSSSSLEMETPAI